MRNWDAKLLERVFPHFAKKIIDGKSFAELLMMLLETEGTFHACLSNRLAKFVSQILFANSQNNIGRKKRSYLQEFGKLCFQKPKKPLMKQRAPLSERRGPMSMRKKTDAKHGACTHICALDREIFQVRKDGELGCQTVGEDFSSFC